MKKSEILKEAKKLLWDGKTHFFVKARQIYICHCIDNTKSFFASGKKQELLINWICHDLLEADNRASLGWWLSKHHPEFIRNDLNMQTLRHKWIDWMIQYWEEQGD